MLEFLDVDSNKLVISEFYQNDKAGKYNYNTVYQREKVWSDEKKSFLIDSILKNYPIPPIFLRMKIDSDTGSTKYEVIDGKQRLTSIKDFIDGNIFLPEDFGGDGVGNEELNGASFEDLGKQEYEKYKKQFWHYRIPVIFIETTDEIMVKSVFDRLNRNGEPLVPQELRHAKYSETDLYKLLDKLTQNHIWREYFNNVLEIDRMEDKEFVSELLFIILENRILSYTKESLDSLYEKWTKKDLNDSEEKFISVSKLVEKFSLDYNGLKIGKVSHLYAIWILAYMVYMQEIDPVPIGKELKEFYKAYLAKQDVVGGDEYRKSMSSNTKGVTSRARRIQALIMYLNSKNIQINMSLER